MGMRYLKKCPINSSRLKSLIESRGYSVIEFAESIGYSPSSLYKGLKQKKMSFDLVEAIQEKLNLSELDAIGYSLRDLRDKMTDLIRVLTDEELNALIFKAKSILAQRRKERLHVALGCINHSNN